MLNVNVTGSGKGSFLSLPTTIDEVSIEYLTGVTSDVRIEPNYALVALCVSDKLSTLCSNSNKNKNIDVKAISIFVRSNDPHKAIDVLPGEKLICAPTDIMIGHEVTAPRNILSPSKVTKLVNSTKELSAKIFTYTEHIWLVTFKLVPLNAIHGSYKNIDADEVKTQETWGTKYLIKECD